MHFDSHSKGFIFGKKFHLNLIRTFHENLSLKPNKFIQQKSQPVSLLADLKKIFFLNIAFWLVNQNNRKIKNDNNDPESTEIKKNSVVNSESKKYKYIYISQWICSASLWFWWLWPWAIPNSCILACSLIVSLNL